MRNFRLVLLLLIANSSYGQINSDIRKIIDGLNYSPSYINLKFDPYKISVDTIRVEVKYNPSLIISESYFIESKRSVLIKYFFEDEQLRFITTSEVCPTKPKLTCFSNYYITKDTVNQKEHSSSREISLGVIRTMEEIQEDHFCPQRFEYGFLEKYIWILLKRIKAEHQ